MSAVCSIEQVVWFLWVSVLCQLELHFVTRETGNWKLSLRFCPFEGILALCSKEDKIGTFLQITQGTQLFEYLYSYCTDCSVWCCEECDSGGGDWSQWPAVCVKSAVSFNSVINTEQSSTIALTCFQQHSMLFKVNSEIMQHVVRISQEPIFWKSNLIHLWSMK